MSRLAPWSEFNQGEEDGNGCGYQQADDEQTWYMGLAPCYRANAAYSLYGVLKGEKDTGCNAKTYINSFFTTQGVETFTQYMQYAGTAFSAGNDDAYAGGVSSVCAAEDSGAGYDDGYGYSHGDNIGAGYSSYTVGCSAGGQYVEKTFAGQYCTESTDSKVTNELTAFNEDLSQIHCKSIYSSEQQGSYNQGASPVEVLAVSRSCSVLEYPQACPDPHGKLIKYERRLEDSTGFVHNKRKERARTIVAWMLLVIGLLLVLVSFLSHTNQKQAKSTKVAASKPEKKPNLWQRMTSIFRRKDRKARQKSSDNQAQ
eukprot:scaffold31414_cov183-Amphora_coffeaeformis.AAC.4